MKSFKHKIIYLNYWIVFVILFAPISIINANSIDSILNIFEQSILHYDVESSLKLMDQIDALEILENSQHHLRNLWLNSSYYYHTGHIDKSFEIVKELKNLADFNSDSIYIERALYRTGTLLFSIGKTDLYLDYIRKAKNMAFEIGDTIIYARCGMGELNIKHHQSDDFEEMKGSYLQYFKLVENIKSDEAYDTQLALLFNLNLVYKKHQADFSEFYNKIFSISNIAKRQDTYAGALHRMHSDYLVKKDTAKALKILYEAYDISAKIKENSLLSIISSELSKIYHVQNNIDKAYEFALKTNKFSQARAELYRKSANNALSKYNEFNDLIFENKKLLKNNELAETNVKNLRMINWGIGAFVVFGLLGGYFLFNQTQIKNHNKIIMAKQEAQLWNERFISGEKDKKMKILNSFQQGQEIIRDRIASVLHDKIAGGLAGTKLLLSNEKLISKEIIKPILNQLDELYDYSRNLSHFYYDPIPEDIEFCELIQKKVKQSSYNTGISIQCILFPNNKINSLAPLIKTEVYRYISELIRNMEIHSKATTGEVSITYREDGLYIIVTDNGVGKSNQAESQDGIGLQIILKRLALLNGNFEINAEYKKGYSCSIFIPEEALNNITQTKINV